MKIEEARSSHNGLQSTNLKTEVALYALTKSMLNCHDVVCVCFILRLLAKPLSFMTVHYYGVTNCCETAVTCECIHFCVKLYFRENSMMEISHAYL